LLKKIREFLMKHMWDDDVVFYNFKDRKRNSSCNFFIYSVKRYYIMLTLLHLLLRTCVQMGKKNLFEIVIYL
jgi:hypothetical protein